MNEQTELPPKYYVRSGQLSAVVLAFDELHAAARLIQMMMAGKLSGLFEPTIQVSESGRADDAVEVDTYEVFLILGLFGLNVSREQFERFYFPQEGA